MARVRFCGGARDGAYIPWHNDRPWPPEICTATTPSGEDHLPSDSSGITTPAVLVYERYQRLGAQDFTGAELYASAAVVAACRRGVPLSSLDIAPVHHSRSMSIIELLELFGVPLELVRDSLHYLFRQRDAHDMDGPIPDELSHEMDSAEMSGSNEYPLDAVAAENIRREAALRKAQNCIDTIGEVIE